MPIKRANDRRVQKTELLLHQALGSLIREKPYDDIAVNAILDRANVGRSTFYTHFRDKHELLASGIQHMMTAAPVPAARSLPRSERVVQFSRPIFEHIDRHRREGDSRTGAIAQASLHERLREVL